MSGAESATPGHFERLLILYARRFPVRRGKLRVIDALWKLAAGEQPHRIAVTRYDGLRMPCDLREVLQRQYYFFGTYFLEETILAAWAEAARGAQVVFDVGANGGIYSLAALAANPQAAVHAFEPTPEIAERLRRTVALNRLERLTVHESAVLHYDGPAILRRFGRDLGGNDGANFVNTDAGEAGAERVAAERLDTVCERLGIARIDLLKLDVQGHEMSALEGAASLLAAGRIGLIFMELNWGDGEDGPAQQAVRRLERAGYGFSHSGPDMRWRAAGDWMRGAHDIVAASMGSGGGAQRLAAAGNPA